MSGIEPKQNEQNRDENQPRYTRDAYNEWKPNTDTPTYEAAIQEALRQVKEEGAFFRRELPIGVRAGIKPKYNDDVPGMTDLAMIKLGGEVIQKDDETITEDDLVNRLEALLEHERNQ